MPATLANPRDPWHNYGSKYIKTGASRGTSTSSGVFTVETLFPRRVEFALAYDEATRTSVTQTGGGPADTQATWYFYQPITQGSFLLPFLFISIFIYDSIYLGMIYQKYRENNIPIWKRF